MTPETIFRIHLVLGYVAWLLVLGTYMVWDARRLKLCQRYFERMPPPHSPKEVQWT